MQNKTIILTKRGMKKINKTISHLERVRKKVISDLRALRKESEKKSEYAISELRVKLSQVDEKLQEMYSVARYAKITSSNRSDYADIGTVVTLKYQNGVIRKYQLVESIEADPIHHKISISSPLGILIRGKRAKETFIKDFGRSTGQVQLLGIESAI